jgi:hypothetical protein
MENDLGWILVWIGWGIVFALKEMAERRKDTPVFYVLIYSVLSVVAMVIASYTAAGR